MSSQKIPSPIKQAYVCECGHAYDPSTYHSIRSDKCANPKCHTPLVNCTLESGNFIPYRTSTYYHKVIVIYKEGVGI